MVYNNFYRQGIPIISLFFLRILMFTFLKCYKFVVTIFFLAVLGCCSHFTWCIFLFLKLEFTGLEHLPSQHDVFLAGLLSDLLHVGQISPRADICQIFSLIVVTSMVFINIKQSSFNRAYKNILKYDFDQ